MCALGLQLALGALLQQEIAEKKRDAQMEQEQRQLVRSAKSESMKGEASSTSCLEIICWTRTT